MRLTNQTEISNIKSTEGVAFSRRWARVLAALVDWAVLFGPYLLFFTGYYFLYSPLGRLAHPAIVVLYYVLLEGKLGRGQTLGKRLLGLRVVTLNGSILSYKQAFMRQFYTTLLPYYLPWLLQLALSIFLAKIYFGMYLVCWTFCFAYPLIDINFLLADPHRRALHDYLAGSYVLRIKGRYSQEAVAGFIKDNYVPFSLFRRWVFSCLIVFVSFAAAISYWQLPSFYFGVVASYQQPIYVRKGFYLTTVEKEKGILTVKGYLSKKQMDNVEIAKKKLIGVTEFLLKQKIVDKDVDRQVRFKVSQPPKAFKYKERPEWKIFEVDLKTLKATYKSEIE